MRVLFKIAVNNQILKIYLETKRAIIIQQTCKANNSFQSWVFNNQDHNLDAVKNLGIQASDLRKQVTISELLQVQVPGHPCTNTCSILLDFQAANQIHCTQNMRHSKGVSTETITRNLKSYQSIYLARNIIGCRRVGEDMAVKVERLHILY